MNEIIYKEQLSENVFLIKVHAELIAEERLPGQFVIIQLDTDYGERIPLTIADADTKEGSITLIIQAVGKTTRELTSMNVGNVINNVVGPLGTPTHIEKVGTVICVGGGIGIAPLHPVTKAMKEIGNKIVVISGARTKELNIMEKEMRAIADEYIVCTDDGSYGRKCLVTEPLKEYCEMEPKPAMVIAMGPPVMMKFCAITTKPYNIHTLVSLNPVMVDGTGMCGGCRVNVGDEVKFVCVDGPEFDGHLVDFDNMIQRLGAYKEQEEIANHKCNLELVAN